MMIAGLAICYGRSTVLREDIENMVITVRLALEEAAANRVGLG